jgi:hypothetical protein
MPGADEVGNHRERDKLTIAQVCADLSISRRTSYEWRQGRGAQVHYVAEWHPAYPQIRVPALADLA